MIIGYWRNREHPELPVPVVNSATLEQVKAQLEMLDEIISESETMRYRGWSNCRICGCQNGTYEYKTVKGVIPVGLRHYITEHHVLVPGLLDDCI